MTDPMELASRVEATAKPDRELDAAIWLHLPEQEGHAWKHGGDRYKHAHQIAGCSFVPAYTASLDAAMSLVPPHLRLMLSEWDDEKHLRSKGPWQAVLSKPGQDASFDAMRGYRCEHAATPALALTAAALRARAHQGTAHVEQ